VFALVSTSFCSSAVESGAIIAVVSGGSAEVVTKGFRNLVTSFSFEVILGGLLVIVLFVMTFDLS